MATDAKYGISAVNMNSKNTHIEKVKVHSITSGTPSSESVTETREQVVNYLKTFKYVTLPKSKTGKLEIGANVGTVEVNGETYIRTDSNKTAKDNLEDLPTF